MRIGFDVAQTCVEKAGCGWYADALVRELVRLAPAHEFYLYHQFGGWINLSIRRGTFINASNVFPSFLDISSRKAATMWRNPGAYFEKLGAPDIIHACCYQAPKVPGAKLVYTIYDVSFWAVPEFTSESNRMVCNNGVQQALLNADGFVFISESARSEFDRMLPGWLEKSGRPWAITPLGPRQNGVAAVNFVHDYWLSVGSLEPRKNYAILLDALELYWGKSLRRLPLRIAGGSGWMSEGLRVRIRDFSARGLVTYLGYVPEDELLMLYAGAEAFIFPSWYEGFGLPVLEAMAAGCPVISSDRTSLPEIGGNAPLYINPSNAHEIAAAMIRLESDRNFRDRCVSASLLQASNFSWRKTAEKTLRLYQMVMNHNIQR